MKLRHVSSISSVSAEAWDRQFDPDYPFTRHAFLAALERHGCVGAGTGWEPCHLLAETEAGQLLGAVPLYLKTHSYGEFVFDFSWANASHQLGKPYYPKLVSTIPFTPVCGPRLGTSAAGVQSALGEALLKTTRDNTLSSTHLLFLDEAAASSLEDQDFLTRLDVQFQWRNRDYADFAGFLGGLSSDKRKKLQRERRRIREAGLHFRHCRGEDLSESDWHDIYALYANTYAERGQSPYLSLDFFLDYGRAANSPMRVLSAHEGERRVAAAICLHGGDTLYGRNWGARGYYHSLHFETCYYQGIEFCIREGLSRFDAGVQGAHKLARGFDPVTTRSAHHLQDPRLHSAVAAFLQREREAVEAERWDLLEHSAFRAAEQERQRSTDA